MDDSKAVPSGGTASEERVLGRDPINRLFVRYALITLAGMGAQIAMVILEGMIIGNGLGSFGLAVVSVILPLELLSLALGSALGLGTSAIAGQLLGSQDEQGARRVFAQGLWLTLFLLTIVAAAIYLNASSVAVLFGATDDMIPQVTDFIHIYMFFYPFCSAGQMLCSMLRMDEKPSLSSTVIAASAAVAIAWLYASTYVFHFGVTGAAFYYGLAVGLWFVSIFYFMFSRKTIFKVHLSDAKLDFALCGKILLYGLPSFLVQAASFVYSIVVNNYLSSLGGEMDLAAFAVVNGYVVYIVNMVCTAASYGLQPIAGYNDGAKHYARLRQLLKWGLLDSAIAISLVVGLFIVLAEPICSLFCGGDEALLAVSASHVLPLVLLAPLGCLSTIASVYFQTIGSELVSTLLGVCRYVLFTIPIVVLFAASFGLEGIWWAQPVADALAFAFACVCSCREMRRLSKLSSVGHGKTEPGL